MSLFDFIEQPPDEQELPNLPASNHVAKQEHAGHRQADPAPPLHKQPRTQQPGADLANRPPRKVEKFNFLKPCPLCHGRDFIYGQNGGFFCIQCQPGHKGTLVSANGAERESTLDNELKTAHDTIQSPIFKEKGYFQAAFPWIMENLQALQAAGWTRPELFSRSRQRWPTGSWGVAWLGVWVHDDLRVSVGPKGKLVFIFTSCGREIVQTARPSSQKSISKIDNS